LLSQLKCVCQGEKKAKEESKEKKYYSIILCPRKMALLMLRSALCSYLLPLSPDYNFFFISLFFSLLFSDT
jgi:hypothetical protein